MLIIHMNLPTFRMVVPIQAVAVVMCVITFIIHSACTDAIDVATRIWVITQIPYLMIMSPITKHIIYT